MSSLAGVFALLIGLSLGLLGAGGSAVTVPVFAYVLGMPPKEAIASSLPVIGIVSLVGAFRHWRCGNVNGQVVSHFAPAAMLGAFGGARLAAFVSGTLQLVLFAAVMLTAAVLMFRDRQRGCALEDTESGQSQGKGWQLILLGAVVGGMTGFVGVGGGFLIVPSLVIIHGIPIRTAIGTSLAVIAANAAAGFAGYLGQVPIQWDLIGGFSMVATVGIVFGAALSKHISQLKLRKAFAVFLAGIAVFILAERWDAAARTAANDVGSAAANSRGE